MEFSSLPLYQDPPNWPPQQDLQQAGGPRDAGSDQLRPATTAARPGSMAEKARLAKLPQPAEPSQLKCPRCESTNTKFCYFNNYNLTQPRHFCKTCRRYWTRGGALRSVPVGGGCRRNKRTKPKTPSTKPSMIANISSSPSMTSAAVVSSAPAHQSSSLQMPSFFHPHLHNLPDFGNGSGFGNNLHDFQNIPLNLSARFADMWRSGQQPQFPFLAEQFQQEGHLGQQQGLGRSFLSINPGNELETTSYWSSGNMNAWNPDLSASSTSSTTYLL